MFGIYITLLVSCVFCYVANKKKLPTYLNFSGGLVLVVLFEELIYKFLESKGINGNPIHHLYQLVEIWLLMLAYYGYYKEKGNAAALKTIKAVLICTTIVCCFLSLYVEGIYNKCMLSFLVNSLLMIIFSALFFNGLYYDNEEINILSFGFFWINAGHLIYACGTFFQMGLSSYVNNINHALAMQLNLINHVLNYFLYATYLVAFLCTKKQTSS